MFKLSTNGRVKIEGTPFEGGFLTFDFKGQCLDSRDMKWRKAGRDGIESQINGLSFKCVVEGGALRCEAANKNAATLDLRSISLKFPPCEMPEAPAVEDWLEYIHPLCFDIACGVKKVGAKGVRNAADGESSMLYILANRKGGDSLLFSSLPPHRGDFMRFKALHAEPHLEGAFGLEIRSEQARLLAKGQTASTSAVICVAGSDPLKLQEKAGDLFAKGLKRKTRKALCGWNSWDYFAGAVSSKDILSNLKAAQRLFKNRLTHFVIDEGYEPRWGVWDANWKFPEGLDGYCKKIRQAGCVPGIWTAPTMVNTYNEMFREHPEYFGRNDAGQIATKLYSYGPMAFLDITHPEAEDFVFETFSRLKRCGFGYFKVDFTGEVVHNASVFHDRSVPRGMILRKLFECIRRAIGEDSYLLACGAPFESVAGIVDACRVSGDIHNFWGHVCANTASIAGRWWMHGRLWSNDPDFLIARTTETCTHPRMNRAYAPKPFSMGDYWLGGREMNVQEAKVYALILRLSAGDIFLSDDLPAMNRKGVDILEKATANPLSKPALPYDMFKRHDALPSIWIAEDGGRPFVGFVNWTEDPQELTLDLKKAGVKAGAKSRLTSFWGDFKGKLSPEGILSVTLPPRSCEGFLIN